MVHDLNAKLNIQPNASDSSEKYSDLGKILKYLNYPLQKLIIKSNIDAYGNRVSSAFGAGFISSKESNLFKSNKKVPAYIRYCLNLILGEFGDGNLLQSTNKYKFVRDLPLVILELKEKI